MDLFAPNHILLILLVVLLLFGGKKIPELMRGLGKGIREFNDAKSSVTRELEEGLKEPTPSTTHTATTTTQNNSSVNTTPDTGIPTTHSSNIPSSNAVST